MSVLCKNRGFDRRTASGRMQGRRPCVLSRVELHVLSVEHGLFNVYDRLKSPMQMCWTFGCVNSSIHLNLYLSAV